jgi:hypothetical protein
LGDKEDKEDKADKEDNIDSIVTLHLPTSPNPQRGPRVPHLPTSPNPQRGPRVPHLPTLSPIPTYPSCIIAILQLPTLLQMPWEDP